MSNVLKINFGKRKSLNSVLGLTLDGSRLEGVVLRRTNGALQKLQNFSVALSLDPLTAAPELIGREIRNHLDAVGVRERHCVLGIPLKWVLTAHTELPKLAEEDAANLLQLEAERAFPSDPATLCIANSRCALADGKQYVTMTGVANTQLGTLEQVLVAAKLKPVSFALRLAALQSPMDEKSNGVMALMVGENQVSLQISSGGGVAALRSLDGVIENESGQRVLHAKLVAREVRITLGQLPAELRSSVKHIRVFGARVLAQHLADELELTFEPMGLSVELVTTYAPNEFGVQLPPEATLSGAFSLAARALAGQPPAFEFLPPKPSAWQMLASKYASGKARTIGLAAAAALVLIIGAFMVQQIQLMVLRSRWNKMSAKVHELEGIQQQIRQYRPWFDDSFRSLSILKRVTTAFPEDGVVTAKSIDIRDGSVVSCSGNARDQASFLKTYSQLRAAENISDLKVDQIRGKTPMQFTLRSAGMMEVEMKTENRQQFLVVLVLIAAALLIGNSVIYEPLRQWWSSRSEQITKLRKQVADGTRLIKYETSYRSRWDEMSHNTLPKNTSLAEQQVLRALENWSRETGATVNSIIPQWKNDADEYMTFNCRVEANGNIANLSKFLFDIENDPMALKLDSVELSTRDTTGQQLTLSLQISGLVLLAEAKP